LYTNRILFDDKNRKLLRHMIVPGISCIVHTVLLFTVADDWTVTQIKNLVGIHKVYLAVLVPSIIIYNVVLHLAAFSRIIKYKRNYKDNFSNDMIKNTRWIFYFVLTNLGIMTLIVFVVAYCFINDMGIPFTIAEESVVLVLLLFFIYYLITKPEILPVTSPDFLSIRDAVNEKPGRKYANINLPDEKRKKYAKKLENFMILEKAFLNEDISAPKISEELNIPYHHLSLTINIEFEQNFFNYVNGYRIRYAEELLKDPEKNEESILMIAFTSGFQSKSSFNKAFKALNNMTPSEYRKVNAS
jgi:AraC-like DNA-binding protein